MARCGKAKTMTQLNEAVKAKRAELAAQTEEASAAEAGEGEKAVMAPSAPTPVSVVSTFFEPIVADALTALAEGDPLSKVARAHHVPVSMLRSYLWKNHREGYEKAMKEGADQLAEQAVIASQEMARAEEEIETTYSDGSVTRAVKRFDNVQRSKLKAEALWKMAACKDPERYGSKGKSEEDTSMAAAIMEARKRISA